MKVSCVILAGGSGKRFGSKKQFIEWNDKPLWEYAYETCKKVFKDVVVVGVHVKGGVHRQNSVYNGIHAVDGDRVVIVESARPLVNRSQISTIGMHIHASVSFAMDSTDTIIYNGKILDRRRCYRLQVPQAFDLKALQLAHKKTRYKQATDDTILMKECFDLDPILLEGGSNLFKVTYPEDLKILEVIKCKKR